MKRLSDFVAPKRPAGIRLRGNLILVGLAHIAALLLALMAAAAFMEESTCRIPGCS